MPENGYIWETIRIMARIQAEVPEHIKLRFKRVANHMGLSEAGALTWLVNSHLERYEDKHPHVNKTLIRQ